MEVIISSSDINQQIDPLNDSSAINLHSGDDKDVAYNFETLLNVTGIENDDNHKQKADRRVNYNVRSIRETSSSLTQKDSEFQTIDEFYKQTQQVALPTLLKSFRERNA